MPALLPFTGSDPADELVSSDALALLVGFALDQQITVQKAFSGPLEIKERLGAFDAQTLASADLEAVFREKPAIHRFPGNMAKRVHALAVHVEENYGGQAQRIWGEAQDAPELARRLRALPGYGEQSASSLAAVLAKRLGVAVAEPLVPDHPTLGDVDSAEALADYQAGKRAAKAAKRAARA